MTATEAEPAYTLISIVSDQPMPNVMAVLQDDRYFTHLEFIVSADKENAGVYDTRFEQAYQRLIVFLEQQHRIVTRRPPIDPYDLTAILQACQQAVDVHHRAGRTVIFNITGGTKVMALAAYLCAQRNNLEVVYVESRDRFLISMHPCSNFALALQADALTSTKKRFIEERFRTIDVEAYVALYGREVSASIGINDLDQNEVKRAQIVAQHYNAARVALKKLREEIDQAYKKQNLTWPLTINLKKLSQAEKQVLAELAEHDVIGWNSTKNELSCTSSQSKFLKGTWLEVFVLHHLATSGLFHNVRGNVKLAGVDGEWDVMLTANAKLAIVECKSDASLSQQFGKLRAIQRDRGGLYGLSFFVRSGTEDEKTNKQAKLYEITEVVNIDDLLNLAHILAKRMGIQVG